MQTPAYIVLRLLILKHARNWSYDVLEREVRANLVYRDFTRIGSQKVPDAKTLIRIGFQLPTNPGEFGSDCEERAIECRQDAKTRAGGVVSGYSGGRGVFFRRSRGGISVRGLWGRSV